MPEYKVRFIYNGGSAEENRLQLYDAAVSLEGIARALTISTHAFVNGEVRTRADAAHGASLYLTPYRQGSFVIEAVVWIANNIAGGLFYDFLKYTFQEAVGLLDEEQEIRASLEKRIEPTFGQLSEVLENPLIALHRPIAQDEQMTITVARPRGEQLITFDAQTAAALLPVLQDLSDPVVGHVTRYNSVSRWGRFYDTSEGHIVSFFLEASVTEEETSLVTWSLHEANLRRDGTLYFFAIADRTPSGKLKRYKVRKVSQSPR